MHINKMSIIRTLLITFCKIVRCRISTKYKICNINQIDVAI